MQKISGRLDIRERAYEQNRNGSADIRTPVGTQGVVASPDGNRVSPSWYPDSRHIGLGTIAIHLRPFLTKTRAVLPAGRDVESTLDPTEALMRTARYRISHPIPRRSFFGP